MYLHYVSLVIVVAWSSSAVAFPQLFDSNAASRSDPVTFIGKGCTYDRATGVTCGMQITASTSSSSSSSTTASSGCLGGRQLCPVTSEYNPICGTDGVDYANPGRVRCARMCGKDVAIQYYGRCNTLKIRGG